MSRKFNFIPEFSDYNYIRNQMEEDLKYRLAERIRKTSLGRPLYERINVQVIVTQDCPYACPFCIEKQNRMCGTENFKGQIEGLKWVLSEHPDARLVVTGGEPGLYLEQVHDLMEVYNKYGNHVFATINTTGFDPQIANYGHINLSSNDFVHPDITLPIFKNATYQTVWKDQFMNVYNIKQECEMVSRQSQIRNFSFRYISTTDPYDYDVTVFSELRNDPQIIIDTFRIGDFFVYVTFDYKGNHCRITLGDMYQQQHNNYQDGYSNIVIHPDGKIGINWH